MPFGAHSFRSDVVGHLTADRLSRQMPAPPASGLVRDAFRVAMEERPGPVLLELPEDVAGEGAGPAARSGPFLRSPLRAAH